MYLPPYMMEAQNADRVRDAQRYAQDRVVRELSEPIPTETPGLLQRIKQLIHPNPQDSNASERAA